MLIVDAEGFYAHRRLYRSIRSGEDVEVHRSPQAVACRKRYTVELGKSLWTTRGRRPFERYTVIEAMMGKPANRSRLEPTQTDESHRLGGHLHSHTNEGAICPGGVLSGIVLGGRESRPHGEGPDGSTQLAKETCAGHTGSDLHKPTSLQGISNRAKVCKHHRFRNLYRLLDVELLKNAWDDLNKNASNGVDKVTAEEYQCGLEDRLRDLAERLKTKRYRAKLVRRCYIPKENGKLRPLGIPTLEDKLVQRACATQLPRGSFYLPVC